MHGLPKGRFTVYDDEDLVERLQDKEADIFLHHVPPSNFADSMIVGVVDTPQGKVAVKKSVGGIGVNYVLGKMHPVLDISWRIYESTASATGQRTVFIKCHGFQEEYKFPVYYVEIAYDQDGKPFVKSNVDISFKMDGFAQLAPKPIVTCREEYEPNAEEMIHHYRIFKKVTDGLPTIIRAIKTERGFKAISQKPSLAGSDDISWAFAGDEESSSGGSRLIIP